LNLHYLEKQTYNIDHENNYRREPAITSLETLSILSIDWIRVLQHS